jgi:ABC-2 type transport system permease protein
MSTLTAHRPVGELRVTQFRVIRSEWIKFWSLRSSGITLAAAALLFVGIGLLAAQISGSGGEVGARGDGSTNPIDISLTGVNFAQLVLGTLGVLLMSGEYGTGMIRSTLAAVPRRLPVLWAKIAVFAAVVFPVMLLAAFAAFLGGQAVIGDGGASLGNPGALRAVVGSAAYVTGAGLLGLGLGALLRSTPAAISTFFGAMFLLDGVVQLLLPESWRDTLGPYLPSQAGSAIGAVAERSGSLSPWAGLAVFLGYLAVLTGAAAYRLRRQDA